MKAILCGDDPGLLGIKEVDTRSGVTSGVSGNITKLCNTSSKPKTNVHQSHPQTAVQQQQPMNASTLVTSPPMYQASPTMSGAPISPEMVAVPPPNVVSKHTSTTFQPHIPPLQYSCYYSI